MLVAFDTETTGLELHRGDKMFAFSTLTEDGVSTVLREGRDANYSSVLQDVWDGNDVLIMHHAKFDMTAVGSPLPVERFEDTMLMAHLLLNEQPKGLKSLAYNLAGYPLDDQKKVQDEIGKHGNFADASEKTMDAYQIGDVERTMLLYKFFFPKICANSALAECYRVEKELVLATMAMEKRGVMVNVVAAKNLQEWMREEVSRAESMLPEWVIANIGKDLKDVDLRKLLFTDLKLPIVRLTKKTFQPSTAKDVLTVLFDQFPECKELQAIMMWRSYKRGVTTIDSYLKLMDEDCIIRPDINTVEAKTGRESMSNPNLQNVSKEAVLLNPYPVPARKIFRPRPHHVFFLIDYAGIETRLMVHASQEPEMVQLFKDGGDPHVLAAEMFFAEGGKWENADDKQRKVLRGAAKNAHFALPYGAGPGKMADILGLQPGQGVRAMASYKSRFPRIAELIDRYAAMAKDRGFIATEFGHPLRVPSGKWFVALNYYIQGTATGVIKRAQIRVAEQLCFLSGHYHWDAQILFPVHDEIVIEWPRRMLSAAPEALQHTRDLMIDFPQFSVPLEVEIELATASWAKTEEVILDGQRI